MEILSADGLQLLRVSGERKAVGDALAGKKVLLIYFSAHWCPPCRAFTPVLQKFYDQVKDQGVEIVFVSSDASKEDQLSYMKESHGDWWAVENGADAAHQLKQKFEIKGIPSAVVLKVSDGSVISTDGRGEVQSKGEAAAQDWLAKA